MEVEETSTVTDEDGNKAVQTATVTKVILHIAVTGKTASGMAEQYGFNTDQKAKLAELLSAEYDDMWDTLLAGVSSGGGTGTISLGIYIWPSNDSNYVTSFFGTRVHPIYGDARHHNGIDIGASYGTAVLAAAGGTVTYSSWMGGYGNCIIIDHGNDNKTLYARLVSKREQDWPEHIDICRDADNQLVLGTAAGRTYVAQIDIPARSFQAKELSEDEGDEDEVEVEVETTPTPLPLDMDAVTMTLWAIN